MSYASINLDELNQKIPQNYLWDGFWIDSFKRKTLNVSASFDRIYYRDIMIVYKGVTFFNLPSQWRDTAAQQPWMRMADVQAFAQRFPTESTTHKHVIEWRLFGTSVVQEVERFYIVCDKVFVFRCQDKERDYDLAYTDPLPDENYIQNRFSNRVPLLKKP